MIYSAATNDFQLGDIRACRAVSLLPPVPTADPEPDPTPGEERFMTDREAIIAEALEPKPTDSPSGFSESTTATKPARQTLASLKRRIKVGTRLLCVENTYRPELNGTERVVARTLTVAFAWTDPARPDMKQSWTDYPKASGVRWIDEDTFELELFKGQRDHYVRLRFLN